MRCLQVYSADKPPWCQPWTILSTGTFVISSAWYLCHDGAWTILALSATTGVAAWWYLFLVLYPAMVKADAQPPQQPPV